MIKPRQLQPASNILIVSPASEIASFPRRTDRGINALKQMGYSVDLSLHAREKLGKEAGTPQQRASDIMNGFCNAACNAIIASTGGYTSLSVLQHLDYEKISAQPKILTGHSDISALLLGLHARTGMVTFHGPTILPSFGDAAGVHPETAFWFQRILTHNTGSLDLPEGLSEWSDHELIWDNDDTIPRSYQPDIGSVSITPGVAEGPLLGGNLDTVLSLLATPYCPDFTNAVLFLEEIGGTTSKTIRGLKILEYTGILDRISGLVLGRRYNYDDNIGTSGISSVFSQIGRKYKIPVIDNMPIGHTEPKLTLPIGVNARLDAKRRKISLLESAVSI